jgi:hypothetical protein
MQKKDAPLRSTATNLRMPDTGAMQRLFELSRQTPESAEYLSDQFADRVRKLPTAQQTKYAEVMQHINNFRDIVVQENSDLSEFWSGVERDAVVSKSQQYFDTMSASALSALSNKNSQSMEMQFTVNDEGAVMQGMLVGGEPCEDEDTIEQINTVYSNWLIQNDMTCEEGVVFEQQKDDKSKRPVNPDDYARKFMDKEKGFSAFVYERAGGLNLLVTDVSKRALQAGSHG